MHVHHQGRYAKDKAYQTAKYHTALITFVFCFLIFHDSSRTRQALFPRPRGACSEATAKSGRGHLSLFLNTCRLVDVGQRAASVIKTEVSEWTPKRDVGQETIDLRSDPPASGAGRCCA